MTLNGLFCTQMKAWRIVALDGDRVDASGSAFQDLRLKDKVADQVSEDCQEGLVATVNGTFCAQVEGTVDHRAGWRPGERSRRYLSRFELQLI